MSSKIFNEPNEVNYKDSFNLILFILKVHLCFISNKFSQVWFINYEPYEYKMKRFTCYLGLSKMPLKFQNGRFQNFLNWRIHTFAIILLSILGMEFFTDVDLHFLILRISVRFSGTKLPQKFSWLNWLRRSDTKTWLTPFIYT